MERSLYYKVLSDKPIPHDVATKIYLAQAMMNQRFTWKSGKINLSLYELAKSGTEVYDALFDLPILGVGCTTTGSDDWNACLLLRFLRWVSTILPEATVTVDDAGQYILAEWIAFIQGAIGLNVVRVDESLRSLKGKRKKAELERLREAVGKAKSGQFFATVAARDYVDRQEVGELLERKPELASAPLEEIADHLVFPWDTEWLR